MRADGAHFRPTPWIRSARTASISTPSSPTAREVYESRRERFGRHQQELQRRWSLVANARLVAFAAMGLSIWFALRSGDGLLWTLSGLLLVVAAGLVVWHGRLRQRRDRLAALVTVNCVALARLDLAWSAMPSVRGTDLSGGHPYARDLDIVGESSLLRRIATPVVPSGLATLQDWLLNPATHTGIASRQEAVRELSSRIDVRQSVESVGHNPIRRCRIPRRSSPGARRSHG